MNLSETGPRQCVRDFIRFNSNEYLPPFFVYVFFLEKKYEKLIKARHKRCSEYSERIVEQHV